MTEAGDKQRDAVLERIRKLMARAESGRGNSANEVEIATKRIRLLLDKYNLSMSDLEGDDYIDQMEVVEESAYSFAHRMDTYKKVLASVVGKICAVEPMVFQHREYSERSHRSRIRYHIMFIGGKDDVAIAKSLYMILLRTVEGWMKKETNFHGSWTREFTSYCDGMVARLWERATEPPEEDAVNARGETALMVIDKKLVHIKNHLDQYHSDRRPAKATKSKTDVVNFAKGWHRGADVDIGKDRRLEE